MNLIVFYLPRLVVGGAERVFLRLAEAMAAQGHPVLLLLDRREGELLDRLPPELPLEILGARRTVTALPKLARWLRHRRPAILLSAISHNNIIAIAAARLAGVATRVIVSEHTVLSCHSSMEFSWQHRLMPWLARWFYPLADAVVAVSNSVATDLVHLRVLPRPAIDLIDNPVLPAGGATALPPPVHPWFGDQGPPVLVAAGRLVPVKGFDVLLQAVALARQERPLRLVLLGDGPLRESLLALRAQLGLETVVALPGMVVDPLPYFAHSAGVVMSSRYEGFGLVLVEAMACGTPVAATNCPGEVAAILEEGGLGPLVPMDDPPALAQAMLYLLDHPEGADRRRRRADHFSLERAVARYHALFDRLQAASMPPG
ncbi:MAG: glycosyltransferase [Magnetococcales bacterium]|nr:glycosyltransferase [Magnetococcales bacterium]